MKLESIRTFLSTLQEYRGVRITQTFNSPEGKSLTVQCEPSTGAFVIRDLDRAETWLHQSIEDAETFIVHYLQLETTTVNA